MLEALVPIFAIIGAGVCIGAFGLVCLVLYLMVRTVWSIVK